MPVQMDLNIASLTITSSLRQADSCSRSQTNFAADKGRISSSASCLVSWLTIATASGHFAATAVRVYSSLQAGFHMTWSHSLHSDILVVDRIHVVLRETVTE